MSDSLTEAIHEAERFLERAKADAKTATKSVRGWWYYDGVKHAAAKRASMDLTRALARFRKGQR